MIIKNFKIPPKINLINNQNQISNLKKELSSTDYKIIKCYEYELAGLEAPYNIDIIHVERQEIRDKINILEEGKDV